MHVGALMTFRLPDGAPKDFVRALLLQMREKPFLARAVRYRLARGRLARLAPAWEEADVVDMEIPPAPLGAALPRRRARARRADRAHALASLDRSRPLWECHLIESLEPNVGEPAGKPAGGRFALYFKAHHCAIDGMGAMKMVQKWLSRDPATCASPARGSSRRSRKPCRARSLHCSIA